MAKLGLNRKKSECNRARGANLGGDPAEVDKCWERVKVKKESLYFQNDRMTYIKVPKGLQETSVVRINSRRGTVWKKIRVRAKKMAHSSPVKM